MMVPKCTLSNICFPPRFPVPTYAVARPCLKADRLVSGEKSAGQEELKLGRSRPAPPFLIADAGLWLHIPEMSPSMTVISDPPSNLKTYEVDLIKMVHEHGWQTTSVGSDTNGDPAFSYTTGFWLTVDQPEVVVFDCQPQLAHDVFVQMIAKMRAGNQLRVGQPIEGVLTNEVIYLFPVRRDAGISYLRSSDGFTGRLIFQSSNSCGPMASDGFRGSLASMKRLRRFNPTCRNAVG